MEKSFEMKMDEDIPDDGWGRHRIDDEVILLRNGVFFFTKLQYLGLVFRWNTMMNRWKTLKKLFRSVFQNFVRLITLWSLVFLHSSKGMN